MSPGVAIVTGGGSGIGRAASLRLARDGYAVVVADLNGDAAESVAGEIASADGVATPVAADVSGESEWTRITRASESLGTLLALISNAGIFPRLAFAESRVGDFDRVMAVNLRAAFLGASQCLPLMKQSGGAMVFMTSGAGLPQAVKNPMQAGFSLYGASKAALDRWALGIAPELAPFGIAVNCLCPGAPVETAGYRRLDLGAQAPRGTIAPERVALAIAALVTRRPPETGARLLATEFEAAWR